MSCLVVLTVATLLRQREVVERAGPVGKPAEKAVTLSSADWDETRSAGHWLGSPSAPVVVVEFADFQCPFCVSFAQRIWPAIELEFSGQVSLRFRHWPIPAHPLAALAAVAASCAANQGHFAEYHRLLFAQPESVGKKSFAAFAREAHTPDMRAFDDCLERQTPLPRITRDALLARRIGGTGTPTIVINGVLVRPPYSINSIRRVVDNAIREAAPGH